MTNAANPSIETLARHVSDLIGSRLLDPLAIVLESDEAVAPLVTRVAHDSHRWARAMLGGDHAAAMTAISRVIAVLYPGDEPFDPPKQWWATPLGQAIVRRVGHPTRRHVPYETAGAMLGITRQGVGDLVNRGKLRRHPDGGVDTESIAERINHLA